MNLQHLFTFCILLLLTSCSDDPVSENIIGTWEFSSFESTNCPDVEDNIALTNVDENGCITLDGDTSCNIFFTFSTDGTAMQTVTEDGDTDIEDFTYTTNDDNNTALLCESQNDCETIIVEGDKLTRTIMDGGCTLIIVYKKA